MTPHRKEFKMNHYKKRKKTILFILIFESFCLSQKSQAKTLLESLQEYCVPKDGAGCSEGVKATYDERTGLCTCNSITKRYNLNNRVCEDCISGSFASSNWKTCEPIVCPAGYGAVLVQNGACPNGYGLRQVTNGKCPSGFGLKEYNPTTKKWS